MDSSAPNAQNVCPGYQASNVESTSNGVTADLTLAGDACNVYGFDVAELTLSVEYQTQQRLAVRIVPKYIAPSNQSLYILDPRLTPYPTATSGTTNASSDLSFVWTNDPTFQFQVQRSSTGDVLFWCVDHRHFQCGPS